MARREGRKRDPPVQKRGPTAGYLFLTQILIEKHGCVWNRPGKVNIFPQPLWGGDTVLQSTLVEHVGWEFGQARVHAILHLQTDRTVAEHDQALKQRLGETSSGCLLVHDNGTQLLVITDEYNLLTAKNERYHAL